MIRVTAVKKITVIILCLGVFAGAVLPPAKVNALGVFTVYARDKKYYIYPPEIKYGLNGVYINDINGLCERIYYDSLKMPLCAEVEFVATELQTFKYHREKWGSCIPKNKIRYEIERALLSGKNYVKLASEPLKPETTVKNLREQTQLRAVFSTSYGASEDGRKYNIEKCANAVNGSVILPDQTFSFNGVTGARTEENGYKTAKIIIDGEFTNGIGGGVCQVSTTLYNAVLKAGLEVTEWHHHSLPVSYVQPSFDAMVSAVSDLKIKNVTQSAIYLSAQCNGETLTVKIYGIKNDLEYRLKSYITEIIQAKPAEIKRSENPTATEKTSKNGYKSEGYLCVYQNGKLLYNRKLRNDVYNAINGVVIIP